MTTAPCTFLHHVIFGVCCEAISRQISYQIDEAVDMGKGSNAIISMLHYFFVHHGIGKETVHLQLWWADCKSNEVPFDQHVFDASLSAKPIDEWDISFPVEVQSLANQYERGQMSLCGLFSSTVREASMTHLQGEVNAITKLPWLCKD